jgi:23S rRNA (guanosine2251-2'-O)-methyltransferase
MPRPPARDRPTTEALAGRNAVREALVAGRRQIRRVLLAESAVDKAILDDIQSLCRQRGVPLVRAQRDELDRLAQDVRHQGVVAEASPYPYASVDDLLALAHERGEPPFLLALDLLQDPQNVGSLLRTAEAVGVHGIVLPERRSVEITPAVSRASAGAVEHLRVALVTNLVRALGELKEAGVWVVGVEDTTAAQDYATADLDRPLVLVLGGEGEGMRRLVLEACDLVLRIPMRGRINSLNVAVAGSLLLYRAWQARP